MRHEYEECWDWFHIHKIVYRIRCSQGIKCKSPRSTTVRHFEKWLGNVLYELCELEKGHLQMKSSTAHVVAISAPVNEV